MTLRDQDRDLAFLAHDLSQVLWAIQGRARNLALTLPERAAAEVSLIAEDAAAAAAMLADAGEVRARPHEVIREAWRQACDQAAALERPVAGCRLEAPADAPAVAVPPPALRRILGNLFANAIAARPGDVTVACRLAVVGADLEIAVQDDGPGVAEALRPRLFAPGASTSADPRRGLGLAGSRALCRRWGGDLRWRPSDAGACFVLSVPLAGEAAAADGEAAAAEDCGAIGDPADAGPAAGLSILVVDDDPAVREMLQNLLTSLGHRPVLAGDFEAALARTAVGGLDAALIDLGLPGRSGLDLAARLRERDRELAVVLLTGWGREGELADAPSSCVDLTAVKPLDLPQLRRLLTRAARLTVARRAASGMEAP